MKLKLISNRYMNELLINHEDNWHVPEGVFYAKDHDRWLMLSNIGGEVELEEFKTREEMIEYLKINE